LTQVLQAAVAGLEPKTAYVLALSRQADGAGALESLAAFTTNPAGAAIVNAVGPIRQLAESTAPEMPRRLVITTAAEGKPGAVVQVQAR
jgi:hypothetical protein